MLLAQIISFIFTGSYTAADWIGLVSGICIVFNLILVDRGRLTNYLWGFLGCATWLWVAVMNHLVGDIFSQIFYVVMQFVGVYVWQRQLDRQRNADTPADGKSESVGSAEVKARNITWWQGLLAIVFTVAVYLIVVFTSHATGGVQIWLDGTLLPLGIIGQVLMTYGYRSQWIAWLLLDVIKVVIWWNQLAAGGPGAMSMFVLQVVMLVNGFYGTWVWFHKDSVAAASAQSAQSVQPAVAKA
ncbi:nicotinamide riboside transporter PnuC [Bifidobacterium sp. 81T8]|nr:nicotinamide riboside transporter PnuC [Bifidobacterium simiiventris]